MLLLRWRPGNTLWSKNYTAEITGRACWQSYTTAQSSDFGSTTLTRPWGLGGTRRVSGWMVANIVLCCSLVTEKGIFLHRVLFPHCGTKTGKHDYLQLKTENVVECVEVHVRKAVKCEKMTCLGKNANPRF
jgi:hypothetical protein